jgi:hypothetical protein
MAVATVSSVAGQSVVGQHISTPWLNPAGPFEITQGWGSTSVASEPAEDRQGKHYSHWHAGVDVGCPTNTHLVFPHGLGQQATVVYLDNPNGYGTALILRMFTQSYGGHAGGTAQVRNADIYFGHLASRLVKNGATVREGDVLAVTDSTGNSTGPHLHFEVRPPDGKYGTDVDPSQWLLQGNAALQSIPFLDDPFGIKAAEKSLMNTLTGLAQTALGGSMMLAGGVTMGFGLRGLSAQQAARATRASAGRLGQRRREFDLTRPRQKEVPQVTAAGRTRLRPSLRREIGNAPAPPMPTGPRQPTTRAEARGLVPYINGVPAGRKTAAVLRRRLPVRAA